MADKITKNEFVYVTATGKKYHFNSTCSYIKNKESYKISLEEAKIKFEGACYRCFKNNNQSINSKIGINNNFNLNIIQNNKNNLILNINFLIFNRYIFLIIMSILKIITMSNNMN